MPGDGVRPVGLLGSGDRARRRAVDRRALLHALPRGCAVSVRELAVWALLAAGTAVELGSCLALLALRSAADRLHLTAPAGVLAPLLVGAAVLVSVWWSATSLKMIVVA